MPKYWDPIVQERLGSLMKTLEEKYKEDSAIPKKSWAEFSKMRHDKDQVEIGMWWISGKNNYQSDLIHVIEQFPGDIYGQVIGRSDQPHRFLGGDYTSVFDQAQKLGMRYIEPWNHEF